MNNTNNVVRIFPPKQEIGFLYFPLLFLPFFFYLIHFGPAEFWDHATIGWAYFITSFFFLNSIHILFTFEMLLSLDEFREFRKENDRRMPISFFGECAVVFCLCSLCFYKYFHMLGPVITLIIYNVVSVFHSFRQMVGLGVVYDQLLVKKYPKLRQRLELARRKEKAGQNAYLILLFLHSALLISGLHYGPKMKVATFFMGVAFCLYVYAITLQTHKFSQSNKSLYLLRIFLFPLSFVYLPCSILVAAFHGIEYLYVYKKLKLNSKTPPRKGMALFAFWPVLAIFTVMIIFRPIGTGLGWLMDSDWYNASTLIRVSNTIFGALLFLHYYVDSRVYNMKTSAVRDNIGPLFLGESDIKS